MNVGFNKGRCSGRLRASCQWHSCVVLPVCELRSPSMSDFLEGLESSGWLKHIKAILDAGIFIAKVSLEVNPCCLPHRCAQYECVCCTVCVCVCLCTHLVVMKHTNAVWYIYPALGHGLKILSHLKIIRILLCDWWRNELNLLLIIISTAPLQKETRQQCWCKYTGLILMQTTSTKIELDIKYSFKHQSIIKLLFKKLFMNK